MNPKEPWTQFITGLAYVTLYVSSVEASLIFYRDRLGLKVLQASPHFAMLSLGNTNLGLHAGESAVKAAANLHLSVRDLDQAFQWLLQQGVDSQPPKLQPWGVRTIDLTDPDGHRIELVE